MAGIIALAFMGIVFHLLQEDNSRSMLSPNRQYLRHFNTWFSERFGFSRKWIFGIEIGALSALGFTLMQIGEWAGAIACWVLLGSILFAKALAWHGVGGKGVTAILKMGACLGAIALSTLLITITDLRKPDNEPWSNLAKLWNKKTSAPASANSMAVVIPHLQARLVIDAVRNADLDFHIEIENIGALQINELRGSMRTPEMTAIDAGLPLAPTLPPAGRLSIPGMPVSGLKNSGSLFVDLNYDSNIAGTANKFTSSYSFMLRPNDMKPQSLLPVTWQEKTGAVLSRTRDAMGAILKTLSGPSGTMMFSLPLRRTDGTPNFVAMSNEKRQFIFDGGLRLLSFTTTSKTGERKAIKYNLPDSSNETVVIACAWDDARNEATLFVDGKVVP
jgi:hypothetical protein